MATVNALLKAAQDTPSPGAGLCATWISNVFAKVGIATGGNACCMYFSYCNMIDETKLRPGMIVAISQTKSSHGGPRPCGHYGYGHVGIYMANGKVRSSVTATTGGGKVIEESLAAFKSRAFTGCSMHFGWAGGVALTGTASAATGSAEALKVSKIGDVKSGSKGTKVKALQAVLNGLYGCSLAIDGSCGKLTAECIKLYQQKHALTADGCCGPKTWAALFGVKSYLDVLQEGAANKTEVKALQAILASAHGHALALDGSFGSATKAAVEAFQKANGLTVDGSCGPATWKKLLGLK